MRRNIDAWWPHVEAGVEAIVVTASGCGVQVRDYGHLLADDAVYAEKAAKSANCAAIRPKFWRRTVRCWPCWSPRRERGKLAFHSPCTLQHGLKIRGVIEGIFDLPPAI
jgi:glycolate oxidase iron-sulfur subunit